MKAAIVVLSDPSAGVEALGRVFNALAAAILNSATVAYLVAGGSLPASSEVAMRSFDVER